MSSFINTVRADIIKSKRSASFWLSLIGAAFIPTIFLLAYLIKPEGVIKEMKVRPWEQHFFQGWQVLSFFLLPMFIVLICSLLVQIEYKNNTWKQVYTAPQSLGNVFFSKFLSVHFMILFCFVMFTLFMVLAAVIPNIVHSKFPFFSHSMDIPAFIKLNVKTYISILGISAIQFWISLRFKNFIVPLGIGLGLLISAIIAQGFKWEHVFKHPFAAPALTFMWYPRPDRPYLENHEWNSIAWFLVITALAFWDLRNRKELG